MCANGSTRKETKTQYANLARVSSHQLFRLKCARMNSATFRRRSPSNGSAERVLVKCQLLDQVHAKDQKVELPVVDVSSLTATDFLVDFYVIFFAK